MRTWMATKGMVFALILTTTSTVVLAFVVWKDRTTPPGGSYDTLATYSSGLHITSSLLDNVAATPPPLSEPNRLSLSYWLGWLDAQWLVIRNPRVSGELFHTRTIAEVNPIAMLDTVQRKLHDHVISGTVEGYQAEAMASVFRKLASFIDQHLGRCEHLTEPCEATSPHDIYTATLAAMTTLYPELALSVDDSLPGFERVATDFGAVDAKDPDPETAALNFVLGGRDCDCELVTVLTMAMRDDRQAVRVVLHGLHDDSIADIEYIVRVDLSGDMWQAGDAWQRQLCRRGLGDDGRCM